MKKLWISLFALFLSLSLYAQEKTTLALGVGGGTPGVPSVMLELWPEDSFFVFRAHGGSAIIASGAALDLGIAIDNTGDFRQYVGISGEAAYTDYALGTAMWVGGGPKYGMRYKGFYADIGAGIGAFDGTFFGFELDTQLGVFPMVHAGYAWQL